MDSSATTKQKKLKLRGTGTFNPNDNSFDFKPFNDAPSTQTSVKTCAGGGKRWTTTGATPLRMITLKCKESSADMYSEFAAQFAALTKDMKPKSPSQMPERQRLMNEGGMEAWLNQTKGRLTYTGSIDLTTTRNWQADLMRQMQLIVRRLPGEEKFRNTVSKLEKGRRAAYV